jgi:hypothetical protein
MNDLTSTNIVKQSEMRMSDGSVLVYNIDITLQTRTEFTIAYQQIKEFSGSSIDPIEHMLVHLLVDPSIEEEDDEDDQGGDDDQDDDDSIDDDDDNDPEQQEQKVIDFYLGGENPDDSIDEEDDDELT